MEALSLTLIGGASALFGGLQLVMLKMLVELRGEVSSHLASRPAAPVEIPNGD